MGTIITILEIVGIFLAVILVFAFGVLFARHNQKKSQAIQNAANASAAKAKETADDIIAKARKDARDDADRAEKAPAVQITLVSASDPSKTISDDTLAKFRHDAKSADYRKARA